MGHERSAKGSDDSFAGDFRLAPRKGLRQLGTFRVLVADDHRLMLAAVRRALADAEDFEIVSEVSVGSACSRSCARRIPTLCSSTCGCLELDGFTCLARLRKHDPTIAVVILSSYNDAASIEAARRPARSAIVKTIEPVDLPAVLRSAPSGQPSRSGAKRRRRAAVRPELRL